MSNDSTTNVITNKHKTLDELANDIWYTSTLIFFYHAVTLKFT